MKMGRGAMRVGWRLGLVGMLLVGCTERIGYERHPTPTPPAPHQTPTPTPTQLPPVAKVPAVPPEVQQAAAEWPLAGKDYANTRATFDSTITMQNVAELGAAWSYSLHGASKWGSAAGAPLIAGGIVYFQDLDSNVYAFDLQSGSLIWRTLAQQSAFGPNGPAIGWGKIFVQDGGNHLVALNLADGHQLWTTPLFGPTGANQPLAYGGYVYTGVADGSTSQNPGKSMSLNKAGTSGYTFGVDQATGRMVWSFQTVEEGFWGNPGINSGAGVWFPPAIDTATGMTFWATGNPSPMPGILGHPNGSSRPGPNLYSESVLALDGKTGQLAWYYQVREHDLFNYDLQNQPILATAAIGGQPKDVVIATGKMGYVYCLDRATGELYWQTPVGKHENDDLTAIPADTTVMVLPGFWGGVESPAAVAEGVVYAAVANLPSPYDATAFGAQDGNEAVANIEGRIEYASGSAEVVALDIDTGAILWDTPLPAVAFGAATVVNDLVFTATYDGVIYALARADGSIVWSYQAPGGIIAWPAVAGDMMVWPIGLGREPQVLALRLGAQGGGSGPAARNVTTPTPAGTPFVPATPVGTGTITGTGTPGMTGTVTGTAGVTGTATITGMPGVTGDLPTPTAGIMGTPGITGTPAVTMTPAVTVTPAYGPAVTGTPLVTGTPMITVTPVTVLTPVPTLTPTPTPTPVPASAIVGTLVVTGTAGITGGTEITGTAGITGALGITGVTGITGALEITGGTGITGTAGITGAPGISATGVMTVTPTPRGLPPLPITPTATGTATSTATGTSTPATGG